MEKEIIIGNKKLEILTNSGKATGVTKQIIQNTSSYGGGGVIVNGRGYVAPPRIYTTNHPLYEFYLKMNEREMPVTIYDQSVAIKEGHNLTLIWGSMPNLKSIYMFTLINHDTDYRYDLINNEQLDQMGLLSKKIKLPIIISIIIFFIPFGILFLIGNYIRNKMIDSKTESIRRNILTHIDSLIHENGSQFKEKSKAVSLINS